MPLNRSVNGPDGSNRCYLPSNCPGKEASPGAVGRAQTANATIDARTNLAATVGCMSASSRPPSLPPEAVKNMWPAGALEVALVAEARLLHHPL